MKIRKVFLYIISILIICTCSVAAFADDSTKPLFEFNYLGSHIKTYASYSVVDGKACNTHRYYVKSGNLVLVDQELNANPRDIFIHFDDGKSYIAVITKGGRMVSLGTEDLCAKLQEFKNQDIRSLADNIYSNSTTMYFEYKNGSTIAYDCITGKVIKKTAPTEKKDASSFFNEYFSDMIGRSTEIGIDTSGARAQSIIVTLENSGSTLEQLVDAGVFDNLETDYENGGNEVIDYSDEIKNTMGTEGNTAQGTYTGDGNYIGEGSAVSEGENLTGNDNAYDYRENEEYQELMDSKANELSNEQLSELKEMVAAIARGDIDSNELMNVLNSKSPENAEHKISWTKDGEVVTKDVSALADIRDEETKSALEKTFSSVEQHRSEKDFITSKVKDKFIAAYNANGERYDIFSLENVLSNPENLESEAKKLGKEKASSINKMLTSHKDTDTERGMKMFSIVMVLILVATICVLVFARKAVYRKEVKTEEL